MDNFPSFLETLIKDISAFDESMAINCSLAHGIYYRTERVFILRCGDRCYKFSSLMEARRMEHELYRDQLGNYQEGRVEIIHHIERFNWNEQKMREIPIITLVRLLTALRKKN